MDAELIRWWKPIIAALDPWHVPRPDQVDALYVARPDGPAAKLRIHLRTSQRAADLKVVLCGARGSGKSTELVRLAQDVREDLCPVQVDLGAGLPDRCSTLTIVTLLGAAALRAIKDWSSPTGEVAELLSRGQSGLQGALNRFGDAIGSVGSLINAVGPVLSLFLPEQAGAAKAVGAAMASAGETTRAARKLRQDLARGPLGAGLSPDRIEDAQAVVDAVNVILDDLRTLAGRPVVLLADGLDKRTELDDVREALADIELLRGLEAPLVLTVPINPRHDPRLKGAPGDFRLEFLNNIGVRRPDETESNDGIELMRGLYERRRATYSLSEGLVGDEVVRRAAVMSSGIVREFFELLSWSAEAAIEVGMRQIEPPHLETALRRRRLTLEGYLNEQRLTLLRRVLEKGILPTNPEADVLLFENIIVCYANGDLRFRPHEALVDYVRRFDGDG